MYNVMYYTLILENDNSEKLPIYTSQVRTATNKYQCEGWIKYMYTTSCQVATLCMPGMVLVQ